MSPALQVDSLPTEPPGKPFIRYVYLEYFSHSGGSPFHFLNGNFWWTEVLNIVQFTHPPPTFTFTVAGILAYILHEHVFLYFLVKFLLCFYLSYLYLELSFVYCKVMSQNTLFLPMEIANCPSNMHLVDQPFSASLFSHLSKTDNTRDAIPRFFILFHWPIFVSSHTTTTQSSNKNLNISVI